MASRTRHQTAALDLTATGAGGGRVDGGPREDVAFDSAGERCDAWFFRPRDTSPWPCVVMAHGFGGVRAARLDAFAERFAEAGIAALVFDYRHLGTSAGQPRGLIDVRRQREDYRSAVAYARSRGDVDSSRIALWGASFSGGHVLDVAASDSYVAAAVITNPYVDGPAALRKSARAHGLRNGVRLVSLALADRLRESTRQAPIRVRLAGPPGSVAIFTTPDAEPGFESIRPSDPAAGWESRIPARVLLQLPRDRPAHRGPELDCPLLVCVSDHDRIAPVKPAVQVAKTAPHGRAVRFPLGHFDVFTGSGFEDVVPHQVAFLRQHLGLEQDRGDR